MVKWTLITVAMAIAIRLLVIFIKDDEVYKERQITKNIKTTFSYEPSNKGEKNNGTRISKCN